MRGAFPADAAYALPADFDRSFERRLAGEKSRTLLDGLRELLAPFPVAARAAALAVVVLVVGAAVHFGSRPVAGLEGGGESALLKYVVSEARNLEAAHDVDRQAKELLGQYL